MTEKSKDITRKCIVTSEVKDKDNLLRFTITPDNEVIPDFRKKLPFKGVYVSVGKSLLQKAIDKNIFSKAFAKKVKAGEDLMNTVESILSKNGLEAVSLARKAGIMVTGFEKVKENLKKNKVAFIMEAKNAGNDGHNKIVYLAQDLKVFALYNVEELDEALDKGNTVHIAFLKSEMADMVQTKLTKFETFLNS